MALDFQPNDLKAIIEETNFHRSQEDLIELIKKDKVKLLVKLKKAYQSADESAIKKIKNKIDKVLGYSIQPICPTTSTDENGVLHVNLPTNSYLLDSLNSIRKTIVDNDTLLLEADTGCGKSTAFFELNENGENITSVLNSLYENSVTIFVVPTNVKLESDANQYQVPYLNKYAKDNIYNNNESDLLAEISRNPLIASNQNNLKMLIDICEKSSIPVILVIDECHSLIDSFSYKEQLLREMSKLILDSKCIKKTIYCSATPYLTFFKMKNIQVIKFHKNIQKEIRITLTSNNAIVDNRLIAEVLNHVQRNKLVVVLYNHGSEQRSLKKKLIFESKKSIVNKLDEANIVILNKASSKSSDYLKIISNGDRGNSFRDDVNVIITTSILQEAVSLYSDRAVHYIVVSPENYISPNSIKQFIGRFRYSDYQNKVSLSLHLTRRSDFKYDKYDKIGLGLYMQDAFSYHLEEIINENKNKLSGLRKLELRKIKYKSIEEYTRNEELAILENKHYNEDNSLFNQWRAIRLTLKEMSEEVVGIINIKDYLELFFKFNFMVVKSEIKEKTIEQKLLDREFKYYDFVYQNALFQIYNDESKRWALIQYALSVVGNEEYDQYAIKDYDFGNVEVKLEELFENNIEINKEKENNELIKADIKNDSKVKYDGEQRVEEFTQDDRRYNLSYLLFNYFRLLELPFDFKPSNVVDLIWGQKKDINKRILKQKHHMIPVLKKMVLSYLVFVFDTSRNNFDFVCVKYGHKYNIYAGDVNRAITLRGRYEMKGEDFYPTIKELKKFISEYYEKRSDASMDGLVVFKQLFMIKRERKNGKVGNGIRSRKTLTQAINEFYTKIPKDFEEQQKLKI